MGSSESDLNLLRLMQQNALDCACVICLIAVEKEQLSREGTRAGEMAQHFSGVISL